MCRALGSSRTREKEPCDRVLSLPCGFHTHAQPISRKGPRNLAISAAAHNSLRLPRKTMPHEATGRSIPYPCHAKRTLRARFPTPATRIHVRDTCGGHLAPHPPRDTRAQQRPNARFPTPATRIHPPVPSRARQCIRSPIPATRNARPPCVHATRPDANPHGTE